MEWMLFVDTAGKEPNHGDRPLLVAMGQLAAIKLQDTALVVTLEWRRGYSWVVMRTVPGIGRCGVGTVPRLTYLWW